jgi:hypothetical protein
MHLSSHASLLVLVDVLLSGAAASLSSTCLPCSSRPHHAWVTETSL